jgi:hypothetical protein
VPSSLLTVLRRGMNNDPGQRQTAAGLREELRGGHRDDDPTVIMRVPLQPHGEDPTRELPA